MKLYANKLGDLEEMDKSLEMCKQEKLIQEKIENVKRPITSKGIESARYLVASVIENLIWLRS